VTETVWPALELSGADAPVLEPLLPPHALRIQTTAARARSDMYVVLPFIQRATGRLPPRDWSGSR
jgi:hypothetical protein